MGLKEYLEIQMAEKNISGKEIERRSEGDVTDTHISAIRTGKSNNPTLRVMLGIAKALEVDPIEVFKAAAEVEEEKEGWTVQTLSRAIRKVPSLKPNEIKQIKKLLKIE